MLGFLEEDSSSGGMFLKWPKYPHKNRETKRVNPKPMKICKKLANMLLLRNPTCKLKDLQDISIWAGGSDSASD